MEAAIFFSWRVHILLAIPRQFTGSASVRWRGRGPPLKVHCTSEQTNKLFPIAYMISNIYEILFASLAVDFFRNALFSNVNLVMNIWPWRVSVSYSLGLVTRYKACGPQNVLYLSISNFIRLRLYRVDNKYLLISWLWCMYNFILRLLFFSSLTLGRLNVVLSD